MTFSSPLTHTSVQVLRTHQPQPQFRSSFISNTAFHFISPLSTHRTGGIVTHLVEISKTRDTEDMGGLNMQQRPWTPTKRRGPIAAEFSGPGPAWVTLPSMIGVKPYVSGKSTSPCFTFGCRHTDIRDYAGPGPGTYNVMGLGNKGKAAAPSASLHYRHSEPKPFITPAPGSYCPEKSENLMDASPKYSFGLKPKLEVKSNTPAPNFYNMPPVLGSCPEGTMKKAPAYTISGRGKEFVDFRITNPGPGKYDSGNLNTVKKKSPSYSLSVRTQLPSDDTKKPGPGAHSPEKVVLTQAPAHTFGIKHSPFTANLKNGAY